MTTALRTGVWKRLISCIAQICIAAPLMFTSACSLPSLKGRSVSSAYIDTDKTPLGRAIAPKLAGQEENISGIQLLFDPYEALAARILLAQAAERSIDAQYYIWHGDISGTLLFEALYKAAERGVRVRLLLDDNGTQGIDRLLAALNAHPNIEIRLFNPFLHRNARWFGFLTDFPRLNRRMHNKLYVVDNQAAIVGGRNIGDEYFDVPVQTAFIDADLLGIGPVVRESSRDFDRYWASRSAYPAELILPAAREEDIENLHVQALGYESNPAAGMYIQALKGSGAVRRLLDNTLEWHWAPVRMISDPPAKGLGKAKSEDMLPAKLFYLAGMPEKSMEMVTPYFVPRKKDITRLTKLAGQGTKVHILTNSLMATDVPLVHSGYVGSRKPLLKAGISLYEWRHQMPKHFMVHRKGLGQSSSSSLHAKTFAIDGKFHFVGSFNYDPRSIRLNTECGFIIHSEEMASLVEETFLLTIPYSAYEVHLSPEGSLYWLERREDGGLIRHDKEPYTSWWQRLGVDFFSLLPIKWLL